ncbi:fungal-specific transcription factor domain-containing protein [Aspergillus recurvatus]
MPSETSSRASRTIACRRCHARKAAKPVECAHPRKKRLIKVSEQSIENLVAENQRLRGSAHPLSEESTNAPVLAGVLWFVNADALHTPILVAEASDAAFASRFRQAMSQSRHGHLPRVNFPSDEQLLAWSETECPWPTPARARLLVQAALNGLGRCYHIGRLNSGLCLRLARCIRTKNPSPDKDFPGVRYFCQATNILRVVSERPSVDMVEIQLLLSVYSLYLNRRHATYSLAGSAVRLAIIMGRHLNIPESQLSDAGEREHRNRIFWTAYIFDRMWAAKLGYSCAISDDEIGVSLPSSPSGLAQKTSLSHRAQEAFGDLRRWLEELPPSLQCPACSKGDWDPKARSLISYSTRRPILLHVLRVHLETRGQPSKDTHVPASTTALSKTCIRCARHSCGLLVDSWTNGSFMVFDFFYTQYLFSSATILAISVSLHGKDHQSDEEQFEVAASFLLQLRDNGNYAAAEFHKHPEAITDLLHPAKIRLGVRSGIGKATRPQDSTSNLGVDAAITELSSTFTDMTAGTALFDPFKQELLEQPPPDLEFIDSSMYLDGQQGLYWPNEGSENFAT